MSITVYVPNDSGAVAMGADQVAAAISKQAQNRGLKLISCATALAACTGWNQWLK